MASLPSPDGIQESEEVRGAVADVAGPDARPLLTAALASAQVNGDSLLLIPLP